MLWRVIHDTLKWFWPAIFGGAIAIGGVAVAASEVWPEAKAETGRVFTNAIAMLNSPWPWVALLLIFVVWLAAFVWSGKQIALADRLTEHVTYADLAELLKQFRGPQEPPQHAFKQPDDGVHEHITGAVAAIEEDGDTLHATGVLGLWGLYIGNIIVAAGHLASNRYLELAIVGYNGSAETIQVSEITGRIRAGISDLRDYSKLPTPLFHGVFKAEPYKEFVLQMRQDVSADQAEEYLVALGEMKSVGLDLRELNIMVASLSNPDKRARFPLWDGVNLRRRDDVVSNRNTIVSVGAAVETNVSLSMRVTRADGTTEDGNA